MVGYVNKQGVPGNVDLENNGNQTKYTVNKNSKSTLQISKPLCTLMAIGAILLAILVGLVVFFTIPRCNDATVLEALTQSEDIDSSNIAIEERLPRNIFPKHYKINIKPNIQNGIFNGEVTISLNVQKETSHIIFHVNEIQIDKNSLTVRSIKNNNSEIKILNQDYTTDQKYKIDLENSLKKDEEYLLNIKYEGKLNDQLQGFYQMNYMDISSRTPRFAASTQFSPTDARRAFPCFDEPSFKAKFSLNLARPVNMSTLSNMMLLTSKSLDGRGEWYWDFYETTPEISTYLVAFVISDLVSTPTANNIINIWTRNSLQTQTHFASDFAPKVYSFFTNYFQIQLPFRKIDIVALPEFGFSAMENWGLITFRESVLLYDNRISSAYDQRTAATVIAHEFSHQWFGNLVTPKWWSDLWLKEGFATYLQYIGVNFVNPNWNILEEFLPAELSRSFAIDALQSSRPLSINVQNNEQIQQSFNEIAYAKGACIIRMMSHFLGETVFQNGLTTFLNQFKYKNADRHDLFDVLTKVARRQNSLPANETVGQIMRNWIEKPGFPVIQVRVDEENAKLILTQKRFTLTNEKDDTKWWIPISITTENLQNFEETEPKVWLKGEKEITIDHPNLNSWYILNINQTGYFIVNYDEYNWNFLIDNIINLPTVIRAQLISDAMDLARANQLDYDIPLKMIARMAKRDLDIMFVPTLTAFNKLEFLSDILSSTPAFGYFEEYQRAIFQDTYHRVTFNQNLNDYREKRIQSIVLKWACKTPESGCVHESRTKFREFMTQGPLKEAHLKDIIYCTAIREGTEVEWEFAYKKYNITDSVSERNTLLDALGCTRYTWLLARYLNTLIDEKQSIHIQDVERVFKAVASNKFGTELAFNFLRSNWDTLHKSFGKGFNTLSDMIQALGSHLNTEYQLSELKQFKTSIKCHLSSTCEAFDNTIEKVRTNIVWLKKNYNSVEKWLTQQKYMYL